MCNFIFYFNLEIFYFFGMVNFIWFFILIFIKNIIFIFTHFIFIKLILFSASYFHLFHWVFYILIFIIFYFYTYFDFSVLLGQNRCRFYGSGKKAGFLRVRQEKRFRKWGEKWMRCPQNGFSRENRMTFLELEIHFWSFL